MQLAIELADLVDRGAHDLARFVQGHLDELAPTAPPESRHALGLEQLRASGARLWVVRADDRIVASGALAPLTPGHEELKSMRTDPSCRGRGIAGRLLRHLLDDARERGVGRVSLETGSMAFFAPARSLYLGAGFEACGPFGSYVDDPNSVFLTREL